MRLPRHTTNAQKIFAAVLILLSSLLVGCVYSIHPLYQEGKTILEPGIAGAWTGEDSDEGKFEVTLAEVNHSFYKATFTKANSDHTYVYDVYLLRLREQLYADMVLDEAVVKGETIDDAVGVVPLHVFAKVAVQKDTVNFALLNHDWLRSQFAAHKLSIPHEDPDKFTIIFTAPPPKLQEFLRKISTNPDAFDQPLVLHPKK